MAMALSVDKRAYCSGGFCVWFETFLLGRLFYFRDFLGVGEGVARI